jgi:sterol desaturase/sphingolipid hydroxylase (fatty acid hydroxylase superfamily)
MQRITPDVASAERMLMNKALDFFSSSNVYVYFAVYGFLIFCLAAQTVQHLDFVTLAYVVPVGFCIWTFLEYLIHRFVFHWKAQSNFGKKLMFVLHEVHHAYPQTIARSITPLIFSLPTAFVFYLIYSFAFGVYANALMAGSLLGYVCYSIVHDSTHHFPMNFIIGKSLKRHHLRHHYFDTEKNFGVTSVFWDWLFGTKA